MLTVKRSEVKALIEAAKGRFFGGVFIKANGSERRFAGRTGVSYVNKTGRRVTTQPHIVKYWDAAKRSYRSFDLNRLEVLAINGQRYRVIDG